MSTRLSPTRRRLNWIAGLLLAGIAVAAFGPVLIGPLELAQFCWTQPRGVAEGALRADAVANGLRLYPAAGGIILVSDPHALGRLNCRLQFRQGVLVRAALVFDD